jgi:hypothetical protein
MAGTRQKNWAVSRPLRKEGRDCPGLRRKIKGLSDEKSVIAIGLMQCSERIMQDLA